MTISQEQADIMKSAKRIVRGKVADAEQRKDIASARFWGTIAQLLLADDYEAAQCVVDQESEAA